MSESSDFLNIYSLLNKALDRKTKLAYNEYKRILIKYVNAIVELNELREMVFRLSGRSEYASPDMNDPKTRELWESLDEAVTQRTRRRQDIKKLRQDAVRVERFIKEINPESELPFLDVDYLKTNIRPGTHVQLTFMPSGRFLELSRPLEGDEYLEARSDPDVFEMNDNDDLWDQARSTGYSVDRQLSGRGLPVALGYNPLRNSITYHDGRHRNIANYNINGKDAVMPVLIFSDTPTRKLPDKHTIPERQGYASPKNIPKINEYFAADIGSLSGEARDRDVEKIREVGNYGEYGYPQGMSNRRKEIAQFKTDAEFPSYTDTPFMFDEDEQKLMPTTTQRKIKSGMSETFKAMTKSWLEFKKARPFVYGENYDENGNFIDEDYDTPAFRDVVTQRAIANSEVSAVRDALGTKGPYDYDDTDINDAFNYTPMSAMEYRYSKGGIPHDSRMDRFLYDNNLTELNTDTGGTSDTYPQTDGYLQDVDINYEDTDAVGGWGDSTMTLGHFAGILNRYSDEEIMSLILHEITHYAEYFMLTPEQIKEVSDKSFEINRQSKIALAEGRPKDARLSLIEWLAMLLEGGHFSNSEYKTIMSPAQKNKIYNDRANIRQSFKYTLPSERAKYKELWDKMTPEEQAKNSEIYAKRMEDKKSMNKAWYDYKENETPRNDLREAQHRTERYKKWAYNILNNKIKDGTITRDEAVAWLDRNTRVRGHVYDDPEYEVGGGIRAMFENPRNSDKKWFTEEELKNIYSNEDKVIAGDEAINRYYGRMKHNNIRPDWKLGEEDPNVHKFGITEPLPTDDKQEGVYNIPNDNILMGGNYSKNLSDAESIDNVLHELNHKHVIRGRTNEEKQSIMGGYNPKTAHKGKKHMLERLADDDMTYDPFDIEGGHFIAGLSQDSTVRPTQQEIDDNLADWKKRRTVNNVKRAKEGKPLWNMNQPVTNPAEVGDIDNNKIKSSAQLNEKKAAMNKAWERFKGSSAQNSERTPSAQEPSP